MKKYFKKIVALCVCLFSIVSVCGCSCSRPASVNYKITVSEDTKALQIRALVEEKYREPAGTPCYKKEKDGNGQDKYVLVTESGVSECYTNTGEKFERATYKLVDKKTLDEKYPINRDRSEIEYTSSTQKALENEKYSLIYTFEISSFSKDEKVIYFEAITAESILGYQVKEDSLEKITITYPTEWYKKNNANGEAKDCMKVDNDTTVVIKIEIKNLVNSDLTSKGNLQLNLNLNIVTTEQDN